MLQLQTQCLQTTTNPIYRDYNHQQCSHKWPCNDYSLYVQHRAVSSTNICSINISSIFSMFHGFLYLPLALCMFKRYAPAFLVNLIEQIINIMVRTVSNSLIFTKYC